MDFPISVPSIGLVDGKFADENPLTGTTGSLIPSQWGNAVTLEMLNVIEAAGLVPDEDDNTQLMAAVTLLAAAAVPAATEAVAGKARLASQVEAEAGADNSKIMTAQRVAQQVTKRIATQIQVTTGSDDATFVTPLKLAVRLAAGSAVVGSSRNLKMTVSAASASAILTADEVVVKTALGGAAWLLSALNKTINLAAANGVGAMDTGAAPANGFVGIYLCLNPLLALSASNPMLMAQNATPARLPEIYGGANMPAGYTASALVGVWRTNASGQFIVGGMEGRDVSFTPVQVLNTSVGAGTPTVLGLSTSVPKNAVKVGGSFNITSAGGSSNACTVQADVNGTGQRFTSQGPGTAISAEIDLSLITDQTLYYTCTVTAAPMGAILTITSFRF